MTSDEVVAVLAASQATFVKAFSEFQQAKKRLIDEFESCRADLDTLLPVELGPARDAFTDLELRVRLSGDRSSLDKVVNAISTMLAHISK